MILVAGLGNPEAGYAKNRHNFGFMAADELCRQFSFSDYKHKFSGLVAEGKIAGEKVLVLKPLTFMNRSGISVSEAANFYKLSPEQVIVFHDDLDLDFGKVKAKKGGGNAGHNGLKSIDAHFGNAYIRIRLGISHPDKQQVVSYVLADFTASEREEISFLLSDVANAFPELITGGTSAFTNKLALLRG
ncbi:MAG: aminoacyl-tRNA hydrolase [Alphaproteobacteria bacterium]|nr:aminoacyl-tRNA hydrolase [Alphaproteobacteria bacterium]